jgi:GNAT superfamily N-acetyltransferase
VPQLVSRFRRYLRAHGASETLRTALRRLLGGRERVIVLIKELDAIVKPARVEELRVEDIDAGHLADLSELNSAREQPYADRRFADYVQQGFHAFVAYRGERAIGYYWWVDREASGRFPDLSRKQGLGIELGDRDAYGSDFFVLEEHRGGGIAGEFLFKIESSLHERGYTRLWGYVVSDNRAARWTYSTRGYKPMWMVDRTRVLFVRRSTRVPL